MNNSLKQVKNSFYKQNKNIHTLSVYAIMLIYKGNSFMCMSYLSKFADIDKRINYSGIKFRKNIMLDIRRKKCKYTKM